MFKKTVLLSLFSVSFSLSAAQDLELYHASADSLKKFPLAKAPVKSVGLAKSASITPSENTLLETSQTQEKNITITRYQQLYKGIPVIGAQVMIAAKENQGISAKMNGEVNGHLMDNIQVNTVPALNTQQAIGFAKKAYFSVNPQTPIVQEKAELQIRPVDGNNLKLVFLVSFKTTQADEKPIWPFFVIDAQSGAVLKQWNNIKTYLDSGPGGNEKVNEYWYGKDGLPSLDVVQKGNQCLMDNDKVRLVNLGSKWDWDNRILTPFQYLCNQSTEENVNGGFSPTNDAYFFGHVIVDMYKNWYGLNALQNPNGSPMKLLMRVHFGQSYDNAFWDGQAMSFGDGEDFYPLVSLDVAGHEVTHGFTEQHSGLEYHDQSGALNESLSDMAGQASRAYLLETTPLLYNKAHLQSDEVTWGIGETVVRDSFGKALRFMDYPSSDGSSADCLDKALAQSNGSYCAISYPEVVAFANTNISNLQERQSYIVHTASGVFNKAFYLLSKAIGIKKAYHIMVIANTKYWTPTSNFKDAACGVIYSAKELQVDTQLVKTIFGQVGVETAQCAV